MNNVYEFRYFASMRRKAEEIGLWGAHYRELVRQVKTDQDQGGTGAYVTGQLTEMQARLKQSLKES